MDKIKIEGDGAKWGISDWYSMVKEKIENALAKGPNYHWTSGWYSSKKEIASGKITCKDGKIICNAWCSDDFDTEGRGSIVIPFTNNLLVISYALDHAWELANENRMESRAYVGLASDCGPMVDS
jgi:hypothetical protein